MEEQQAKVQRRKKKRRLRWDRIAVAIVIAAVVVGLVGYGVTALVKYAFTAPADDYVPKPEQPETVAVEQKALDKPIYILVIGRDASQQGEGDAIFLAAVNKDQQTVDIIGIPSNTKIESRDKVSQKTINTFYNGGNIKLMKAVVEDIFHITVPYYVVVDEQAFMKTVDVWGNPDLYVERDMVHFENGADKADINLARGYQHLTDEKALQYMRFLDEDGNAFSRTARSERLIKEVLSRQADAWAPVQLWNVWRVWGDFTTNISTFDALKVTAALHSMEPQKIRYFILPGTKEVIDGTTYWNYDPTEAQQLIGITMGNEPVDIGSEPAADTSGAAKSKAEETPTNDDGQTAATAKGI